MRLSERLGDKISVAIGELPVLDIERQRIDYEVAPAVGPRGMEKYVVMLFLPVTGQDQTGAHDLIDPYAPQSQVNQLVRMLYAAASEQRDALLAQIRNSNGDKRSPGGLITG